LQCIKRPGRSQRTKMTRSEGGGRVSTGKAKRGGRTEDAEDENIFYGKKIL